MLRASACAMGMMSVAPGALSAELSETGEFIDGVAAIVNEGVVLKSQLRDQTAAIIDFCEFKDWQVIATRFKCQNEKSSRGDFGLEESTSTTASSSGEE